MYTHTCTHAHSMASIHSKPRKSSHGHLARGQKVLPTEDWNWDGAGSEIFGTESVKTSAGDWTEGVSSAGGVKSISSSKLSSNSCNQKKAHMKAGCES